MTTLSEIATIVDCEHKTAPEASDGSHFAVGTPAMRGNSINFELARRIDESTFDDWTRRLRPRFGDLLFAREAPVGPVVRIPESENVAPGQRTVLIRPHKNRVDAVYLYYRLASPQLQQIVEVLSAGSTVSHLNVADVRSLPMGGLPSLNVQRAIGEILGALDDKIAANRDVSIRLEELAVATASKCSQLVRLGKVVTQRRSSVSPAKLGLEAVLHFSLPAFDEGRPRLESASEIKSAKNEIDSPAVLVSKLNPRIPRLWPVDTAGTGVRRLASTEFVVLESSELGVGELWAAILQGNVFGQLQSLVGGTSNSHQRVRPQDILEAVVPDVRQLDQEDRSALATLCRVKNQLVEESNSLARTRDELLPLLMNGRITVKEAERAAEEVL